MMVIKRYSIEQLETMHKEDPYLAVSLADEDQIESLLEKKVFSREDVENYKNVFDSMHLMEH